MLHATESSDKSETRNAQLHRQTEIHTITHTLTVASQLPHLLTVLLYSNSNITQNTNSTAISAVQS